LAKLHESISQIMRGEIMEKQNGIAAIPQYSQALPQRKESTMTTPPLITMHGNGGATRFQWRAQRSYSAEVPPGALDEQSRLIDGLIDLAFGTLGARHLDVRVLAAEPEHA
jgi:hypothetical protein